MPKPDYPGQNHYNDVIMITMASQVRSVSIVPQPFVKVQIKENVKAPRHWPLWEESTGDRWIPLTQRASYAEIFSIGWRHPGRPIPWVMCWSQDIRTFSCVKWVCRCHLGGGFQTIWVISVLRYDRQYFLDAKGCNCFSIPTAPLMFWIH